MLITQLVKNKQMDQFFELIENSRILTIGYDYKHERLKDTILSKLQCSYITDVDSKFSLKQFLRDVKIGFILEGQKYSKYLILDLNEIIIDNKEVVVSKSQTISKILRSISKELYNTEYKLIIISSIYRNINSISDYTIKNGTSSMYESDVVFILNDDDSIKIIKNRFGEKNDISIKNLNNYEYSNK